MPRNLQAMCCLAALVVQAGAGAKEERGMAEPERMMQSEVVAACRASLARGAERRRAVRTSKEWRAWRAHVLGTVRGAFPPLLFERRQPPTARVVSRHELPHFRVENVLFESLPGWEVNASIYLPREPGVYPAVVCPTGHSTKTGASYQQSAQVFARNGYVALSFDPPGCAGEMAPFNDHFTNGLIGYLTGLWSQTHFVADAIRCIDYLETRADVDTRRGVGVTGVSGGGLTSLFTGMLDERVSVIAPVCCLAEHASIHLEGLYTSCPEQFGPGIIAAGLDYVDYVGALSPRPCLVLAGEKDEVFDRRSTARIFRDAKRVYAAAGHPERCGLFVDRESGHAYTVAMANEVVRWLNRTLKETDAPALPLTSADVPLIDREKLLCHPENRANMHTLNRAEAERLQRTRAAVSPLTPKIGGTGGTGRADDPPSVGGARGGRDPGALARIRAAAAELLAVSPEVETVRARLRGKPRTSWNALVEEVEIESAPGTRLPGLMVTHVSDRSPRPGVLWIDEEGKWAPLRHNAFLMQALRIFDPECAPDTPRVLSLDVSGLGRLAPEPVAYDFAGWNDIERILTYLSIANARPVMGLRVRDALCGLRYLRSRPEVDPSRVTIGGRGVGAVVALHAALLDGNVRQVVCLEMLSHYGALCAQYPFAWRQSIILPGVLRHYDLPEIPPLLRETRVHVINPLDAQRRPLAQDAANALYADALAAGTVVRCGVDGGTAVIEAVGQAGNGR